MVKGLAENNIDAANKIFVIYHQKCQVAGIHILAQKYSDIGMRKLLVGRSIPKMISMRSTILGPTWCKLANRILKPLQSGGIYDDKASFTVMNSDSMGYKDASSAAQWVSKIPEEEKKFEDKQLPQDGPKRSDRHGGMVKYFSPSKMDQLQMNLLIVFYSRSRGCCGMGTFNYRSTIKQRP